MTVEAVLLVLESWVAPQEFVPVLLVPESAQESAQAFVQQVALPLVPEQVEQTGKSIAGL